MNLSALRRRYTGGKELAADPAVWLFENFASGEEIAALVAAARDQLQRALVAGGDAGVLSDGRSGSNCWVKHGHDANVLQLAQRISEVVGIPLTNAESFQVVHYAQTQEYRPHHDAWDPDTERGLRCLLRGGQRLVTALLYLNDVEEGGATAFPNLHLEVPPTRGNLLLFHTCHAGTSTRHARSLHGGMPVTRGEKWAANLWFREREFR